MSLGAWLVLPFTGLELLILGGGFYLASVAGHSREVIEIDGDHLRVLRGRGASSGGCSAPPLLDTGDPVPRPRAAGIPSRLVLRCHGRRLEVATKLVEAEREDLAAELQGWLGLQHASIERREAESLNPGLTSPAQQAHREGIWQ